MRTVLVQLWKRQRIKTVTIMKYMTVLRHFLKHINHSIEGIDNISLQLIREKLEANYRCLSTKMSRQL